MTFEFGFTLPADVAVGEAIRITFPDNFDVTGANYDDATAADVSGLGDTTKFSLLADVTTNTVKLTVGSAQITAGAISGLKLKGIANKEARDATNFTIDHLNSSSDASVHSGTGSGVIVQGTTRNKIRFQAFRLVIFSSL